MNVRALKIQDLDACIRIGALMHAESVYRVHPFSEDRLRFLAYQCLTREDYQCFVAERNGEIIGLMVGITGLNFFADTRYSADLALYVVPEHRGSTAAVRLVIEFCKWSEAIGCSDIRCGVTTGINDEVGAKLYKRFGFKDGGALYVKQISPL
jgi:GNAT superfamily N-acetyltransferase